MELTDSIKESGILKPILVRLLSGRYQIIDGFHRFSVAVDLKFTDIECKVIECTDDEALRLTIECNAIHKETQPCEYAVLLKRLMVDNEITINGLSRAVHKSPAWIRNCLSLNDLHEDIKVLVDRGQIPVQSAYLLAKLPANVQRQLAVRSQLMTAKEFKTIAVNAIRSWEESIRSGKLQRYFPDKFEPRSFLRSLKQIRDEMNQETHAVEILYNEGAETPLDGWRAAIKWMLYLDTTGIEEQRQNHEALQRTSDSNSHDRKV